MCLCRARPEPGFTGSTLGNVEACEIKPAKNPRIYIYMYTHVCEKRRARLLRAARPHGLVRTRAAAPPPSACPAPAAVARFGEDARPPSLLCLLCWQSAANRAGDPRRTLNGGLVKRWSRVPLSPGRSQSPAAESKALRARPWAASLQCHSRLRRVLGLRSLSSEGVAARQGPGGSRGSPSPASGTSSWVAAHAQERSRSCLPSAAAASLTPPLPSPALATPGRRPPL